MKTKLLTRLKTLNKALGVRSLIEPENLPVRLRQIVTSVMAARPLEDKLLGCEFQYV